MFIYLSLLSVACSVYASWSLFRRLWIVGFARIQVGGRNFGLPSRDSPAPGLSGPEHPRDLYSYHLGESKRSDGQAQHKKVKCTILQKTSMPRNYPCNNCRYFPVWIGYDSYSQCNNCGYNCTSCLGTAISHCVTLTSQSPALTIGDLSIKVIHRYFDVRLTLGDGALQMLLYLWQELWSEEKGNKRSL